MNKGKKFLASLMALSIVAVYPLQALALTKEETVYANLDYTGKTSKTIVTSHLSYVGSDEVQDETLLKDILNVNGDETFTLDNNTITWNGNNQDIFYQGSIEKDLPIEVAVTYYLDGKKVDAKDIVGKSGKIKIEYEFTNNSSKTVNGKTLYTPFVSTLGFMLNGNTTSDVSIDNGKVVSTGTKNMVVGIAAPGLYQSMGIYELKKLNNLTVEYTTTDFEIANMYIVSTPELLSESSFDVFDKMDELTESINLLQTNMDAIEDGAEKLLAGASTLDDGVGNLTDSITEIQDAIKRLQAGSVKLNNGVEQIVSQLNAAKSDLEANATQIQCLQSKNLSAANQIKSQLVSSVKGNSTLLNLLLTAAGTDISAYSAASEEDQNNYIIDAIAYASNNSTNAVYSPILSVTDGNGESVFTKIITNYNIYYLLMSDYSTINELSSNLTNLITRLNTAMNPTESGTGDTVSDGVKQIKVGLTKLNSSLNNNETNTNLKALKTGTKALKNGLQTLTTGIETFNDEGICVLSEYADKVASYADVAKELKQMSEDYKGFASSNTDTTTFIYVIK